MSFWEIGVWCRRGQPAPATFLYQDWWKYMKPMCPRPTNTSSLSPRCPDDTAPRCPKTLVSPRYTRQKDEEKAKHFGSASWKSMTLNIKPLSHPKSFSIQQNSTPSPEPWQQNQSNFNKWKRQITIKQQSVVLWSFWSKVLDWPIVHKVFSFSRVLCLAIQQHLEFQDFDYFSKHRAIGYQFFRQKLSWSFWPQEGHVPIAASPPGGLQHFDPSASPVVKKWHFCWLNLKWKANVIHLFWFLLSYRFPGYIFETIQVEL